MKVMLINLLVVILLTPLTAVCQLAFNIDLEDGIDFGEVLVDEEEERILTASLVAGEGQARWWFRGDDECFTFDPDGVYFEPRGVVQQDITLTFSPDEAADYEVTLIIEFETEEEEDLFTYQVVLTGTGIEEENNPPEVESAIEDLELDEDFDPFVIADLDTVFIDPDEDDLAFSVESNDDNLVPEIGEGNLLELSSEQNWFGEAEITVTADDGRGEAVSLTFTVTVNPVNDPPVWTAIPENLEVPEAAELVFTVEGSDVDEDELSISYSSDDLPEAVEFTDELDGTGTFTWTPSYDDAGEYRATFTLSDGELEITVDVVITVLNVNRTPVWDEVPEQVQINENEELEFNIAGSDPDEDDLTIDANSEDLPEDWEFIDNEDGTGNFSWTPTLEDAGEYTATFTITDGELSSETDVLITVENVSHTSFQKNGQIPTELSLSPAWPNPFNSTTTIRYGLPEPGHVSLQVYNTLGQKITTLFEGYKQAGIYTNTLTSTGLPSGIYIVRLEGINQSLYNKIMLIK